MCAALRQLTNKHMTEVIPVINVENFEDVVRHLNIVKNSVPWVHVDVADGSFTQRVSWSDARDLAAIGPALPIEVHFMVERPEEKLMPWLEAESVFRILVHEEATKNERDIIARCHTAGKQAGIAIKPQTPWEALIPFLGQADLFQMLAVEPGPSGQVFDRRILEKIRAFRAQAPEARIEVDGGIKPGIAHECAAAGANILVASSSLFAGGLPFPEALARLIHDVS